MARAYFPHGARPSLLARPPSPLLAYGAQLPLLSLPHLPHARIHPLGMEIDELTLGSTGADPALISLISATGRSSVGRVHRS
jgi:hypothetical protein